jgi:LPXTG-motif cell wall-anchored protein
VQKSGIPLLVVDLRTFTVASATDAHEQGSWHSPMRVLLAAGVLALVAAAAGVLLVRRRQRRTLVPKLG